MSKQVVYHCDRCGKALQRNDDIYEITIGNYVIKGDSPNAYNNIVESEKYKESEFELCKKCADYILREITEEVK